MSITASTRCARRPGEASRFYALRGPAPRIDGIREGGRSRSTPPPSRPPPFQRGDVLGGTDGNKLGGKPHRELASQWPAPETCVYAFPAINAAPGRNLVIHSDAMPGQKKGVYVTGSAANVTSIPHYAFHVPDWRPGGKGEEAAQFGTGRPTQNLTNRGPPTHPHPRPIGRMAAPKRSAIATPTSRRPVSGPRADVSQEGHTRQRRRVRCRACRSCAPGPVLRPGPVQPQEKNAGRRWFPR